MDCWRRGAAACLIVSSFFAGAALAQTGTRIIDTLEPGNTTNALPAKTLNAQPEEVPSAPKPTETSGGAAGEPKPFVLRYVKVEGAAHLAPGAIYAIWRDEIGKTITLDDIRHIADGIGALYKKTGYALYTVSIPRQSFADGVVTVQVVEGYVAAVQIEVADQHADLALIKAYGEAIAADKPLRQATLERYILLMSDLPGFKVGSKFEAISGTPGAYRLVLAVTQKKFDAGFGFANLGTPVLSDSQFDVNGVANSLLREGDRTQLVYGFPPDGFRRYQYYGLSHQTPLGDDGVTAQLNAGYLGTKVDALSGRAYLLNLHVNDPLIRSVDENLFLNAGFDALNADDAILGSLLSDERTRAFRTTLAYALRDDLFFGLSGTNTAVGTLSAGVPILGARRGSIALGSPTFGKFNTRVERDQTLPWDFIFRTRLSGQFSGSHLPASEEYTFGGEDFGRAFDYDTLNGDRGIALAGELAYQIGPYHPYGVTLAPEVYGWGDWGRVWTADTIYQPASDRAASAGIGSRATIGDTDKTIISLELARDIERPLFAPSPPAWRVVFTIRRSI
jgi:hemolysin activation/secretion protein